MSKPKSSRSSMSAIARMPANIQDKVSERLANGGTWRDVAALLESLGFSGVNAQNVTNYRRGAHKQWLAKQERLNSERQRYALRVEMVEKYAKEGGPAEAALMTAMEMLEDAMGGFDAGDLRAMVSNKPEKLLSLMETMLKMRREMAAIRSESLQLAKEESQNQLNTGRKKGLDPETQKRIEEAMNLK